MNAPASTLGALQGEGWRARIRAGVASSYLTVPVMILFVLLIANLVLGSRLLDSSHLGQTFAVSAPFILAGMAAAMPIMGGGGGLDMAIGPVIGFVTVLIAGVLVPNGVVAPYVLIPIVLAFGLGVGALSGWLGNYVRIPPVIATLGLYLFFTGFAPWVMPIPGGQVPVWLANLTGMYGPVPGILVVYVALALFWLLLSRQGFVRNLLNVGGEDRAAFTSGVSVQRVRLVAYMLGGMFSAIGGMLLAGTIRSGDGTVGPIFTVVSLAAVALGGISLAGGRGGILGAGLGGLSYWLIQNLLTVAGVSVFQLSAAAGMVLIIALALNGAMDKLRKAQAAFSADPLLAETIAAAGGETIAASPAR